MKILITGGAGFIGSHLAGRLLEEGKEVVVLDDFNDYYNPKWKEENTEAYKKNKNFKLFRGDILDETLVDEILKTERVETIIHLAARAGVRPSMQNPALYQKVNVEGTKVILEAARKHGIKNIILASSSSVYGNQKKMPCSEDDSVDNPASPYAATKREMELLAKTYHNLYSTNIACLRFFTVYGEGGRPDMALYIFMEKIANGEEVQKFGDGSSMRDYTYIGDIVDGITRCIGKNFGYEIINLGNNSPVSLNDFIAAIEKATEKKAKIKEMPKQEGDVEKTWADIAKAKRLLGWEPKTLLEENLAKIVLWYKKYRL
ncbi:hypothetical protein A3A21_02885 [Candidatus Jorgensenbacteria bacterium RIFCSPLOWO2_01_FULL_45_25b]|uniref:NAD(P)-binding domain-containing protein n=1 Tax=Candidatus Jorgensenbacteria bacterium RIFCSPLOWO2_01_FULL_45_25b TaxID=1798471 RepID=A0A1F6BTI0_9BACT|nr:MAG: hypothetical protein A3A21_02885 [Candidatus Jorgensenbacteria bacterium RIFCSPLOWO2_01_FULL_45_25b]